MYSYYNKVLIIDVTQKTMDFKMLSDQLLETVLGGKGLGIHLLLENNPPGVNPLDPDNHLILTAGPTAGTPIWGSCRHGVFTKSPLTGYLSESYSGGTVTERMVHTGFDATMIYGTSDRPLWIEICEEGAIFHSADHLWGLDTFATEEQIKKWIKENRQKSKNCGVITIGPAGENLVRISVIENDYWRSAGRTGVGAVMGSKNIKAIAFWGNKQKEVADHDLVKNISKDLSSKAKDDKGVHAYKTMGTPMLVDILNEAGAFPTRYWQKGRSEHQEKINARALHKHCEVKPHACLKCLIACGRMSIIKQGRHKGLKIEGPEYETIFAFGGLCEVNEIEEIAYLNDICDRLGMDTISAGNLVAFTIEASKQGKIDQEIDYGQVDKIASLLQDIAYRRGIGNVLADGIKSAAKKFNIEDQAIHVKGLEPAGYDPRVLKGMALSYGTSDRGACHLRATFYKPELAGIVDPEQIKGKAKVFTEWEDRLTIFDCLILCRFYRDLYQWDELNQIIKGCMGLDLNKESMRSIASTITTNARLFNLREGLTPEEDHLPKPFYTNVLPETNKAITKEQMDVLLQEYYNLRGWDNKGEPKM